MMPDDWKEQIGGHDAILFGAVGWPEKIPDHVSLWGSLLKFRRDFDLYVNLRPARLMPGVRSPLAGLAPGDIDMMIVRENTEGEYSSHRRPDVRGHRARGRGAGDGDVARRRRPRPEVRVRAGAVAAEEAPHLGDEVERHRHHDAVLGRARRGDGRGAIPDVRVDRYHIDILTAHFVQRPQIFDTVVASNLFGDILSDLGPACTGTIGIAPSANINPTREHPSLFEPVHGSAPDIAGRGHRQPDRPDLVGGADARFPRPSRRARRRHRRHRGRARAEQRRAEDGAISAAARARPTSAARSPMRSRRRALHRVRRAVKHLLHERRRIRSPAHK